jgi:hypothetical protein
VVVSGVVDLGLAAFAFGGAAAVALVVTGSDRLPFSLLLGLVGLLLLVSGIGRVRSRLEIHRDSLEWTWALVRQRVPLAELVDADIAEKGRPTPGGAWAGLIGGGFTWVFLWWLFGLIGSVAHAEPTTGSHDLVLIRRHGPPVQVRAIGTWATRAGAARVSEVVAAVRASIAAERLRAGQVPPVGD